MINMQLHKFSNPLKDQKFAPFKNYILSDISAIESAIINPKDCYTEKYQLPLWTFYTPKKQYTEFDKYGNPMGHSNNFNYLEALQVEYDANKMEIEDFKQKFSKYNFYLYTTWSHDYMTTSFRVVLPLERKIPVGFFESTYNKEIMLDTFKGADHTAFQSFHKQKIPACHIDRKHLYEYHINKGINFSIDYELMQENYEEFAETQARLKSRAYSRLDDNDRYYDIEGLYVPKFIEDCVKDKCADIIASLNFDNRGTGVVHSTLLTVFGKMSTCGFDAFSIIKWMKDQTPESAHKEIEDFHKMKKY